MNRNLTLHEFRITNPSPSSISHPVSSLSICISEHSTPSHSPLMNHQPSDSVTQPHPNHPQDHVVAEMRHFTCSALEFRNLQPPGPRITDQLMNVSSDTNFKPENLRNSASKSYPYSSALSTIKETTPPPYTTRTMPARTLSLPHASVSCK